VIGVLPLLINDSILTSSDVSEPFAPSNWSSGTTYAIGDYVTDSATNLAYVSLKASNLAKAPSGYPLYWREIGKKEVAYNAGTTYALGDYSYSEHRVYQSLQASNTGHTPLTSPTWWLDVGPTNRYAMFDTSRNTASYKASPITIVLTPGERFDTLGLVSLIGESVNLTITSGGSEIYNTTKSLVVTSYMDDWYEYFTAGFRYKTVLIFPNLPAVTNMIATITITTTQGFAACGGLVIGNALDLGAVQYNPNIGANNYSRIERDIYGTAVLTPRRSVPKVSMTTWLEKAKLDDAVAFRDIANATPILYAGVTDVDNSYFQSMVVLGVYKQFSFDLAFTSHAVVSLELEEI